MKLVSFPLVQPAGFVANVAAKVFHFDYDTIQVWNDSPNIVYYSVDDQKTWAELHAMEATSKDFYCRSVVFHIRASVAGSACRFELWNQAGNKEQEMPRTRVGM